jgi:eukaryotic-like serine/threonine-protein kinase
MEGTPTTAPRRTRFEEAVKKPVPFGKYYLLERINVGGMAEVFRAKAFGVEGFERLVAVKRILPNIAEDKEFIKMFIDEAKIAVQLNHANIAQIFDLGVVDSSYYIALEHIHGRDLRNIFDRCRGAGEPMPIAQACFVVMKVCEGLDYAHNKRDQQGREIHLVHRDVSPQNVLISFEGEVKLIDFGIAKAAGKGSKTQAGILKGKFGYMSPEQVRGLPIDRRSDIFSCGIVLYELLTGERLFVGESDFSTLEKVRNVEILPPSTYNRRIPDELERIVLKALAKDSDDRYQNAIDLHDELQAFVYTAGEFYSRKDLASWMKRSFAKEIEEESTKLEQYRQLKPPAEVVAAPRPERAATKPPPLGPPSARRTTSMPSVPPPTPGQPSQTQPPPMAPHGTKPPPLGQPRTTLPMPAVVPPPQAMAPSHGPGHGPGPSSQPMAAVAPIVAAPLAPAPVPSPPNKGSNELSWDDDELETQIYDNPEEEALAKARKAGLLASPAAGAAPDTAETSPSGVTAGASDGPDLSSLVSTAKGWDAPGGGGAPPAKAGPNSPTLLAAGAGPLAMPPNQLAAGSSKSPSPFAAPFGAEAPAAPLAGARRESSAIERLVSASPPNAEPFDPMAQFGAGLVARKSNAAVYAAVGAVAVLLGGGFVIYKMASGSSDKKPDVVGKADGSASGGSATGGSAAGTGAIAGTSGSAGTTSGTGTTAGTGATSGTGASATSGSGAGVASAASSGPALNATELAATGFDLYVTPNNVAGWRLDNAVNTSRLPAQIRSVTPGRHTIAVDAPPGFMSSSQDVVVEAGKAGRVEIKLTPIDVSGVFESTPPGARVYLVANGQRIAVGQTPTKYKLDPRMTYQVLLEKDGFVSVSRPLAITGNPEEKVAVTLERAQVASAHVVHNPAPGGGGGSDHVVTLPPIGGGTDKTPPGGGGGDKGTDHGGDGGSTAAPAGGDGVLSLGAKPPCDIYIDGKATGLKTPQREIKLSVGHHKVTLMNNEYGIKESFGVDIKGGTPTKMVKDFSDRIPQ